MRKYSDFIICNHIFMVYEVYRCLYYQEYIYFLLGGTTSFLSTLYHMNPEQKY